MKEKLRLDIMLCEKGYFDSRERARAAIMRGDVFVDGQKAVKAGFPVSPESLIEVKADPCPYVSRGGYKLEKALAAFPVSVRGKNVADVGASTGGFTDCLLQNGAAHVWSIDVGYGQLAWKVRTDPRVTVMERTNIRYVAPADIGVPIDLAVIDVSFISLRLVLPPVKALLTPQGECICLVKPQFEAGREKVGKKGVVRDPAVHKEVLDTFVKTAEDLGFLVLGLDFSPITGPEGNIEYLGYLSLAPEDKDMEGGSAGTALVVKNSHAAHGRN